MLFRFISYIEKSKRKKIIAGTANAKFESLKPNRSSFFIQQLKRLKFLDEENPDNAHFYFRSYKA
jgi:hypothetical protein